MVDTTKSEFRDAVKVSSGHTINVNVFHPVKPAQARELADVIRARADEAEKAAKAAKARARQFPHQTLLRDTNDRGTLYYAHASFHPTDTVVWKLGSTTYGTREEWEAMKVVFEQVKTGSLYSFLPHIYLENGNLIVRGA